MTLALDPFDHRVARAATGLLGAFNAAGVLDAADVHVATRLGRLGGEADDVVLLAVALAVRRVRLGSACVAPGELRDGVLGESEEPAAVAALPWPDPAAWAAACARSPLVTEGDADGRPGGNTDGGPGSGRPIRLVDGLLYLERYWRQEERVRAELVRRAGCVAVDGERLRAALDRHVPDRADRRRLAVAVAALRRVSVLAGGPGTGKTTTVARLLAVLVASAPGRPPRIALAAPTGKAAARLDQAVAEQAATLDAATAAGLAGLRASTLHALLGARPGAAPRHHAGNRLPFDVVVVDETSMVSLTLMDRLLDALAPDARLVLVGDPDQLASVEVGAVLGDITRACAAPQPELVAALRELDVPGGEGVLHGVVTLRDTHRFGGPIAELAAAIQAGDAEAALGVLAAGHPEVRHHDQLDDGPDGLPPDLRAEIDAAAAELTAAAQAGDVAAALRALDAHRVLCAHRRGPFGAAWWGADLERRVAPRAGEAWYPGRPVLVTTNDTAVDGGGTGLHNGDTGVVVATPDGPRVAFELAGGPVLVAPARLGDVLTVHAMTVHRAQGSQFATVTVVLPPADSPLATRELLYTAVTRARAAVRVIGSPAAVRRAVLRPVRRASGLRHRLGRC